MPLRNIVIIAVMAVFSLACYGVSARNRYANLFAEALETVDSQALYDDMSQAELFDGAMSGMLSKLDQHSQYMSGLNFKVFDEDIRQEFGGIGMYFKMDPETKTIRVTAAMPGTPAFAAGLLPGDLITEIEGKSTFEMSNADAVGEMRGKAGTAVEFKVKGADGERMVSIVRENIPVTSVHGDIRNLDGSWNYRLKENPRIGYIRLSLFGDKSVAEFRKAVEEVNGKVDGLIIDLRNNRGGLLTAAVDICDMFLDQNLLIVQTKGRGNVLLDEHYSTSEVDFNPNLPLVILINRESASASEIVAACLRDHKRAVLIGESSWGKGTVQNIIPIQLHKSAIKLTTASYWPPSGKNFDRSDKLNETPERYGVHPEDDMVVEMTEEEVANNRMRRDKRDLETLLGENAGQPEPAVEQPTDDKDPNEEPAEDPNEEPTEDKPEVDRPLQRAIQYFEEIFGKTISEVATSQDSSTKHVLLCDSIGDGLFISQFDFAV